MEDYQSTVAPEALTTARDLVISWRKNEANSLLAQRIAQALSDRSGDHVD